MQMGTPQNNLRCPLVVRPAHQRRTRAGESSHDGGTSGTSAKNPRWRVQLLFRNKDANVHVAVFFCKTENWENITPSQAQVATTAAAAAVTAAVASAAVAARAAAAAAAAAAAVAAATVAAEATTEVETNAQAAEQSAVCRGFRCSEQAACNVYRNSDSDVTRPEAT